MKTLLTLMFFTSGLMFQTKTPFLLGSMLMTQIILSSLLMRMNSNSSWAMMTLMLVMVSGLMIIFLYMTSTCSNMKFDSMKMKSLFWYFFIYSPVIFYFSQYMYMEENVNMVDCFNMEFLKMFSMLNSHSSLFMFLYLLVALFFMINLMTLNKGPMRKKY
uniref:NADH dehydrogenase subunit 6 n=1 Tax=Calophya schini TaxID=121824 RepID=A0A343LDR4_9HEMI|nr:NADH dehydrogenase subunit 6 [Calophya schini]